MSSKFGQIRSGTAEFATLEHLNKSMLPIFLVENFSDPVYFFLGIGDMHNI